MGSDRAQEIYSSPYITVTDAAEWTGWSRARILTLVNDGVFGYLQVGSGTQGIRLREHDVGKHFRLPLPGPRERFLRDTPEGDKPKKAKPKQIHHWVYFLENGEGELLYVGITNQGVGRLIQHGNEKEWWPQVDHVRIEHFPTRQEALDREGEVIRDQRPPFNKSIPREASVPA